ncbi:dipeptide transporter ATP-binding subunit [Salmonella enterica subsp. enterica serovar Hadar str. ATCC 51956]|nr:dipeptide transporter ATP-binding subunit [Salmonella enterica subsp. enterica serovar Hadar str. ATCC 51956]
MSTHEATLQQLLLRAIDLKKHYPVKKGDLFSGTAGKSAGWRVV